MHAPFVVGGIVVKILYHGPWPRGTEVVAEPVPPGQICIIREVDQLDGDWVVRVEGVTYGPWVFHLAAEFRPYEPKKDGRLTEISKKEKVYEQSELRTH